MFDFSLFFSKKKEENNRKLVKQQKISKSIVKEKPLKGIYIIKVSVISQNEASEFYMHKAASGCILSEDTKFKISANNAQS